MNPFEWVAAIVIGLPLGIITMSFGLGVATMILDWFDGLGDGWRQ